MIRARREGRIDFLRGEGIQGVGGSGAWIDPRLTSECARRSCKNSGDALNWNEIRARAASFAREWKNASRERSDAQTFFNEFFEVFGITRRRVAYFEHAVTKYGGASGSIDLFWPGKFLVEQKSTGKSLARARQQALDYFPGIAERDLPRYVLLCDFQLFELIDLETREEARFALSELPQHVEKFGFMIGFEKRTFKDQDPVNIDAAELMGRLHDALEASGYRGHNLERLLVRLLFCLFADDTGIFEPRDLFADLIRNRTDEDGSDVGQWLQSLFEVLNTPEDRRQVTLDEDLARFPYVNGDLFEERLPIAAFSSSMRNVLLEACDFYWEKISPAIFGSLFQSVMNEEERRKKGAHYTTEKNILKLIEPLFMRALREEFARLRGRKDTGRRSALETFHNKLSGLTFFDPACGCGNFLIIAYRELRSLELELLKELYPQAQLVLDVTALSKLNVDQFYGIEIEEFPARIAEVALWMMDHIMNVRLSLQFGQTYARIPLRSSPQIVGGNALTLDWSAVLLPARCNYVMGNPPFGGFALRDEDRQGEMAEIARLGLGGNRVDYVAAWFLKAAAYIQGTKTEVAFVATNSITQGEQVAQIWPTLFERYQIEIAFAHRTFAWGSDARGRAHVHVVIVGFTHRANERSDKSLFVYPDYDAEPIESRYKSLSPYLIDATRLPNRYVVVAAANEPSNGFPTIRVGSKPVDGGIYILDTSKRAALLAADPGSASLIRPFWGTEEFIAGKPRWIVYLGDAAPEQIRDHKQIAELVAAVRKHRREEGGKLAKSLAETPTRFHVTVVPQSSYLAIPEVSSERREYIPIGWLDPPIIPSNKLMVVENVDLDLFGLVTSKMHMVWVAYIGGRLESRFQYSPGVVYNTFPVPSLSADKRDRLRTAAGEVVAARAKHKNSSYGALYDPNAMPHDLRQAHQGLDRLVDRLYDPKGFASDQARLEHLLTRYERETVPLIAARPSKKRRRP